jgi:competence protein ComEC
VPNNASVVLAVRSGPVDLLLLGDVEREAAHALLLQLRRDPGRARQAAGFDVVKVAHHGSRSSSTPAFLAATAPRVAVVSVGDRSRFGHPHPEVVARLGRAGVHLLRTDRDGAVTLSTDGKRVWMATYASGWEARIR